MHMLFAFYGFLCILVVCGSLLHTYMVLPSTCRHLFLKYLVDGAATVNAFKGMNVIVAYFLPPIGITVAVIFRGLCATLMCDWAHTIILFIVVHLCMGHFLGTSLAMGIVGALYDLLVHAGIFSPVEGNKDASQLTMKLTLRMIFVADVF